MVFRSICSVEVVFCSGLVVFRSCLVVFCSAVVAFCSGLVVFRSVCSSLVVFSSVVEVFCPVSSALVDSCSVCSTVEVFCSICSALVGSCLVCSALVGSGPICSTMGGSCLACPTLGGSYLICSALVGSSPVCSALVLCSAGFALVPGLITSTWIWHLRSTALLDCSEFGVSGSRSLGGGYVMNMVYELPLTHHQRSLAHHMDSCTTLTVALHLRLQFPSPIALMKHTADCTDHTLYIRGLKLAARGPIEATYGLPWKVS